MLRVVGGELPIDRRSRVHLPVPEPLPREPAERVCDFDPTFHSLTPEEAHRAAEACIHCPEPAMCTLACPAGNDIPTAMWFIEQGDFVSAAEVYRQTSSLPEICGRVCPHDALCQGACIRSKSGDPVITGSLEAFVTDYARAVAGVAIEVGAPSGRRVAIVGSGPSGLACAERLARQGHAVTVYEKLPSPGGLLRYGIPNFKLPNGIVDSQIEDLTRAGVHFVTRAEIGRSPTVDELFAQGFEAVYLAVGTGVVAPLDVPGSDLPGVVTAAEFLMQANVESSELPEGAADLPPLGKQVVVIGGGDTASDCLRSAVRLGADSVTCLYRRTEAEMPGNPKDRELAAEEGACYRYLIQPIAFHAGPDGRVAEVECLTCRLGPPDRSGRRSPVPVEGSNFRVSADTVVLALGYWPDPLLGETTPGLETKRWGLIVTEEDSGATTRPGVFAGGDAVTGPDLVVTAMVAGHRAAAAIDGYLRDPSSQ